jgi:hypothetical protein
MLHEPRDNEVTSRCWWLVARQIIPTLSIISPFVLIGTTSSGISDQLRDIYFICRCCLNVATYNWRVHNRKIEIISCIVKFCSSPALPVNFEVWVKLFMNISEIGFTWHQPTNQASYRKVLVFVSFRNVQRASCVLISPAQLTDASLKFQSDCTT